MLMLLVIAGGGPASVSQSAVDVAGSTPQPVLIAGSDPMAIVAAFLIIVVMIAIFKCFSCRRYDCKECEFYTYDRQYAAGHVHIHSLHKIDL